MRKVNSLIGALIIVGAMATSARAVPVPPLPLIPPVMGESHLTSFVVPGSAVSIDWIVQPSVFVAGAFDYLYQVENTSAVAVDVFSVTGVGAPVLFGAIGGGGDDLDLLTGVHAAHVAAGELEPFLLAPVGALLTTVSGGNITWSFAPLAAGSESDTLFFTSLLPPTYGVGGVQDNSPPSPWGTLAPGGDPVPVPTPEPATLLLLGSGLMGMGWFGRKRLKKDEPEA